MVCKWYILPLGWLYITYHLLRETETAIELHLPLKNAAWETILSGFRFFGKVTYFGAKFCRVLGRVWGKKKGKLRRKNPLRKNILPETEWFKWLYFRFWGTKGLLSKDEVFTFREILQVFRSTETFAPLISQSCKIISKIITLGGSSPLNPI